MTTPDINIIRAMINDAIHNALGYENGFDFLDYRIFRGVSVESGREHYSPYAFGDFIDYRADVAIDMKAIRAGLDACPAFDREAEAAVIEQEVKRICEAFESVYNA
tara:strand:+ start:143 stop:460 length:318 start_codon:yes stop_codon:yes gene_type:complete